MLRKIEKGINTTICLCGADGAGKSTIARFITQRLSQRSYNVKLVWMRGTHTLAFLLANFLKHFASFRGTCIPHLGICIPDKMKRLWIWIEFVSVVPIMFARIFLPRIFGKTIVAERSPIDFLVWLIITLRTTSIVKSILFRLILYVTFSLCKCILYVRADSDILLARRKGYIEEPLISIELPIYDLITKSLDFPCIDTSRANVPETLRKVSKLLSLCI